MEQKGGDDDDVVIDDEIDVNQFGTRPSNLQAQSEFTTIY